MNIITATGAFTRKVTNREPKLTQIRAQEIMGRNFFGVEEASKHFGVKPSTQELTCLADIPFSEETLNTCHSTHILIAIFPLSILEIRDKVAPQAFYRHRRCPHEKVWYNTQAFAKDRGEIGWHLVRRGVVRDSTYKTWKQQQRLLGMNEKTPTARVLVYTMAGHLLSTRERLFIYYGNENVRCADLLSSGNCVVVSGYRKALPSDHVSGFGISLSNLCTNYNRSGYLSVASERDAER